MIIGPSPPGEFLTTLTINNKCSVPITVYFNTVGRSVVAQPGTYTYNVMYLPAPPLPYQLIYNNQIIGTGTLTSAYLTISQCPSITSPSSSPPSSSPPSNFVTLTVNNQCSVPITVKFYTIGNQVIAQPGLNDFLNFFFPSPLPYQLIYNGQVIGTGTLSTPYLTINKCPATPTPTPSSSPPSSVTPTPSSSPPPSSTSSSSLTPWILLGLATVAGIGLIVYHESRKR